MNTLDGIVPLVKYKPKEGDHWEDDDDNPENWIDEDDAYEETKTTPSVNQP